MTTLLFECVLNKEVRKEKPAVASDVSARARYQLLWVYISWLKVNITEMAKVAFFVSFLG